MPKNIKRMSGAFPPNCEGISKINSVRNKIKTENIKAHLGWAAVFLETPSRLGGGAPPALFLFWASQRHTNINRAGVHNQHRSYICALVTACPMYSVTQCHRSYPAIYFHFTQSENLPPRHIHCHISACFVSTIHFFATPLTNIMCSTTPGSVHILRVSHPNLLVEGLSKGFEDSKGLPSHSFLHVP